MGNSVCEAVMAKEFSHVVKIVIVPSASSNYSGIEYAVARCGHIV